MGWFWKWLGYHVCEEFTQWQTVQVNCTVVPVIGGMPIESMSSECTRSHQERTCTICGKLHQRPLKHIAGERKQ